jgi:hypothetical protein
MILASISTTIHRNTYDALRSITAWALSVVIYYCAPDSGAGERLNIWSLLEGLGFIVSIFRSFVCNGVIKLPCFDYSGDNGENVTEDVRMINVTSPEDQPFQ